MLRMASFPKRCISEMFSSPMYNPRKIHGPSSKTSHRDVLAQLASTAVKTNTYEQNVELLKDASILLGGIDRTSVTKVIDRLSIQIKAQGMRG